MPMPAAARRRLANSEPHGVPHQLNVYVLDSESDVTAYGQHNRLIVSRETTGERLVCVREDVGTGPRNATLAEIRAVMNHPGHRLHTGRTVHVNSERYHSDYRDAECIEHTFRVVSSVRAA